MNSNRRKLLDMSYIWIRQNPKANNLDVPNELLERWIFNDEEDDPKPAGYYFSVFTFGYLQHEMLSSSLPPEQPRSVSASSILGHFQMWQLKLGMVEIHRKTDLRFEPMPLFAFPEGEEIRYWPDSSDPSAGSVPSMPR